MSGQKPREIAWRVLSRPAGGEFIEHRLEQALSGAGLSSADRHLCQELVYGVVRWQTTLDWLIARKTNDRPQRIALINLLRLGLYQVFWLNRIPEHAAVHETVALAKAGGFAGQSGFINAVLRGYIREFDATRAILDELKIKEPNLGYSHPDWLVARWESRWGDDCAAKLMAWNNTPPGTFARVNELKVGADKLLERWRGEGVEYAVVKRDWFGESQVFELKGHPPLESLDSLGEGWFYVQDPSTLLAVRELGPLPGETILDLCAAPGGKLAHAAQLMRNMGRIVAHDAPDRLRLIRRNCDRLGITCVEFVSSLAVFNDHQQFNRVLVDAPCSNTGVLRRRVDLRWRLRPQEIERLSTMQFKLLRQAAAVLAPGGTIVYSTCSLEPEENKNVVEAFLSQAPDFRLEAERALFPLANAVDGAYVARLVRATN